MSEVRVNLGPHSYSVHIERGLIDRAGSLIPGEPSKVAAVADTHAYELFGARIKSSMAPGPEYCEILISPGEQAKSMAESERLAERLAQEQIRRDDLLITIGGGVASDLGGFVGSTYSRGIAVAHIPTTLVGQVDAAIGGKTGVNLAGGKNLIGTIHQPVAVVCDPETLLTLPEREFRSGMAEVVKYGLTLDIELLEILESSAGRILSRDLTLLEEVVKRCVKAKARIVEADEKDQSQRAVLNYGHTFGHALEAAAGYGSLTHGEAISVGMVFAAELGVESGISGEELPRTHRRLLQLYGLPVDAEFDRDLLLTSMRLDKKHRSGMRWVLLRGVGAPETFSGIADDAIERVMKRIAR